MIEIVLAVDLGGTNIRMAAVAADGYIHSLAREKTPKSVMPAELIEITARLAEKCVAEIPTGSSINSIAFASPAPAAQKNSGVLTKLPNIPSLNGMEIRKMLTERFTVPVVLENDATAAAIGESWLGASRGVRDSIMFTLGTGVGGGLILNGEPFRGTDGTAGELGHICVEPNGHPCGCGSRGCLEQYASATAVLRMAREAGANHSSASTIYKAAQQGDPVCNDVFRSMGSYLGIAVAGLVNTLNPEMIVIGGGMAAAWDAFIGTVRNEVRGRAFEAPAGRAKLVRSELGDRSGLLGVARTAFLSAHG